MDTTIRSRDLCFALDLAALMLRVICIPQIKAVQLLACRTFLYVLYISATKYRARFLEQFDLEGIVIVMFSKSHQGFMSWNGCFQVRPFGR